MCASDTAGLLRAPSQGGKEITLETGKIGRQADGSVVARCGDTVLFATACKSYDVVGDGTFAPFMVQYQEKFSAAGKTSGSFQRREGKLRDEEVLTCRLIDRPLRPLFPKGWAFDTQVLTNLMSYDGENRAEPLAITASSAALALSSVPVTAAVAGARVGLIDGQLVLNPTTSQMKESTLDLVMAGTKRAVLMIEGFADFLPEETLLEAVEMGQAAIAETAAAIEEWAARVGKPKHEGDLLLPPDDLLEVARAAAGDAYDSAMRISEKKERGKALAAAGALLDAALEGEDGESKYDSAHVQGAIKTLCTDAMRGMLRKEGLRSDGRGSEDVRPIRAEASALPCTHGSALFTRGETQVMAVCTLGGDKSSQLIDDLDGGGHKTFYLQYNFPPSSVGEVGRTGAPGRREVGHGALAEKALRPALPSYDSGDWGYVTRVESTTTESNGSSSMASVCGGCLAMEDAGVPLKARVAGIAMGLILPEEDDDDAEPIILTDILGSEDALGQMDFKIAGSEDAVTAFQLDIKVEGITIDIMRMALAQAKRGRTHILGEMAKCSPPPRGQLADSAPRIITVSYPEELRAKIIGKGGENIQGIIAESGVSEMNLDGGVCTITAPSGEAADKAIELLKPYTEVPEVGKVYTNCVVKKITPFGAFVEIVPGQDGLIHISDVAVERIDKVEDVLSEGETVDEVKCVMITEKGQIRLSRKACLPGGDSAAYDNGAGAAAAAEAKKAAQAALEAIEVGQEFVGAEVVSVMPYGCFVRLQEGIDALVHVSQFSERRNEDARDLVSEGMVVSVAVEGRNDKGKLQLKKISDFTDSDTD